MSTELGMDGIPPRIEPRTCLFMPADISKIKLKGKLTMNSNENQQNGPDWATRASKFQWLLCQHHQVVGGPGRKPGLPPCSTPFIYLVLVLAFQLGLRVQKLT